METQYDKMELDQVVEFENSTDDSEGSGRFSIQDEYSDSGYDDLSGLSCMLVWAREAPMQASIAGAAAVF